MIVAERGPLVWVFNFSPTQDYEGLKARLNILLETHAACITGVGLSGCAQTGSSIKQIAGVHSTTTCTIAENA